MDKRTCRIVAIVAVLSLGIGVIAGAQLDKVLKGGGIALVVDKFGPDINKGINKLTGDKNGPEGATKVVPILSIGSGAYMGAVQVSGPEAQVKKVKGVAQLETKFGLIGGVRLRALIPVDTKSPQHGISRVKGVGVSALVDIKL